ncbi:cytokine-induced anti-apoptosis inhibitor 1, Fe-S biogenesis-domain-containing protein [Phlyctochytrium arcticum]|nr:cytokine-induced anti-apoptosis inhibitor 1, Fe-S biogenesis-domain-containing protein [Phlyctochytrium arcticum]
MVAATFSAGEKVLLVGNPLAQASDLQKTQQDIVQQVTTTGSVAFEQLDRISHISLPQSIYNSVVTGIIPPTAFAHPDVVLSKLLKALTPNGTLHLREPTLIDSAASLTVPATSHSGDPLRVPTRTTSALLSALKLAGFVDAAVVTSQELDNETVEKFVIQCWGVKPEEARQVADMLHGKVLLVDVVAKKPKYEVGAAAVLSFGKKKTVTNGTNGTPAAAAPAKPKESVWRVSANDDDDEDEELEDEDALLDEEDLIIPATNVPDDCKPNAGKKKACKNCTCGLAEMEEDLATDEDTAKIVVVTPKTKKATAPASSCGNCYLGDAFRCGSCPYIGMPAFKPGEKVVLAGNLLKDDVEL